MASCASGISHRVEPGENLYRIAKAYDIPYRRLGRLNRVFPPFRLKVGDALFIPGANRRLPVTVITPRSVDPAHPPREESAGRFDWPVRGRVTSRFGPRNKVHHDGIDIAAADGSAVLAAAGGKVIFADRLSGYGNVVIVEHRQGFTTVYAHNRINLVAKGKMVTRGERVATVGSSGRSSGPHLHFEIRKANVARDPAFFLPGL